MKIIDHQSLDVKFSDIIVFAIIEQYKGPNRIVHYCFTNMTASEIHPDHNTVAIFKIKPKYFATGGFLKNTTTTYDTHI